MCLKTARQLQAVVWWLCSGLYISDDCCLQKRSHTNGIYTSSGSIFIIIVMDVQDLRAAAA